MTQDKWLKDLIESHEYHEVEKGKHCPLCYAKANKAIQDNIAKMIKYEKETWFNRKKNARRTEKEN